MLPRTLDHGEAAAIPLAEQLSATLADRCRRAAPELRIFNEYGPTEATVGCVVYEADGRQTREGAESGNGWDHFGATFEYANGARGFHMARQWAGCWSQNSDTVLADNRLVFTRWDGYDRGPLDDWEHGRNDLEAADTALVPQIGSILAWLSAQRGVTCVRMSGSGATCFALFDSEADRDSAETGVPREWWRLATRLR